MSWFNFTRAPSSDTLAESKTTCKDIDAGDGYGETGYGEKEDDEEAGGDLVAVEETHKGEGSDFDTEQNQDTAPIATPLSLTVSRARI
jgi:hypothetical protein